MIVIKYDYYRIIFLAICWVLAPVTAAIAEGVNNPVKIAILEFELNDLTLKPRTPEEVTNTFISLVLGRRVDVDNPVTGF